MTSQIAIDNKKCSILEITELTKKEMKIVYSSKRLRNMPSIFSQLLNKKLKDWSIEIEDFSDEEHDILMKNKKLEKSRNNINKLLEAKWI